MAGLNSKSVILGGAVLMLVIVGYLVYPPSTTLTGAADGKYASTKSPTPGYNAEKCDKHGTVKKMLESYFPQEPTKTKDGKLRDPDFTFQLVRLPGKQLFESASKGSEVQFPLVGRNNQISIFADVPRLLPVFLPEGYLKDGVNPIAITDIDWSIFEIGCEENSPYCGVVSFLDKDKTRYEIIVSGAQFGVTAIETVDSLLTNLQGKLTKLDPSCAVAYNAASLKNPPLIDVYEGDHEVGKHPEFERIEAIIEELERRQRPLKRTIPIVLDADAKYYELDPDTVWQRQRAVLAGVNLIYSVIEPLSAKQFKIDFKIKGQEAWLPGFGPTVLDSLELVNEINDPDYHMVTYNEQDELSLFYLGYDAVGALGRVASICNLEGWTDGSYGSDDEHQKLRAFSQHVPNLNAGPNAIAYNTALGRIITSAHEIAHLLGATHGSGAANVCAEEPFNNMCGATIMLPVNMGGQGPDAREPFFHMLNDQQIVACVFADLVS